MSTPESGHSFTQLTYPLMARSKHSWFWECHTPKSMLADNTLTFEEIAKSEGIVPSYILWPSDLRFLPILPIDG